jgi:beta-alanine degradation protein BauB
MQTMNCGFRLSIVAGLLAVAAWVSPGQAVAQAQPRSFEASPDVYKVIAQDANYKVIEVTWKPGQQDQMHSHPASAVYYLTDCTIQGTLPNGKAGEFNPRAGGAIVQAAIAGHSIKNIGAADCKLIMFEPK